MKGFKMPNLKNSLIFAMFMFSVFFLTGCQSRTSHTPIAEPSNEAVIETAFDKTLTEVNDLIYKDRKYKEAMKLIDDKLCHEAGDDRQAAMVLFRKAELLTIDGKYDEAGKLLNESLNLQLGKDQQVYAYSTIAALYSFSNKKMEALGYVNKAKELAKELNGDYFGQYEFYSAYGTVMSDRGKYSKAIEYLEKALKMRPEGESLMIELAFDYLRHNQRSEARKWGEKWINTINPDKASLKDKEELLDRVEEMIKYYIIMEEYEKAFALVREAEKENKGECSNDMEIFYALYYSGNYNKMEPVFKKIEVSEHSDQWEKDIAKNIMKEVKPLLSKGKGTK